MLINCAIIDDEPLAREGIADYVKEIDFLNLVGICESPVQLIKLLDQQAIELIFLDIQMPKMNGIDFLKIVQNPPMVIITTAYPDYALEGFQLNVLDYLLKPITFDRFFKSATKAKDYHQLMVKNTGTDSSKSTSPPDYFFVKCKNKYEKVLFSDILYIEGLQNYVTIHTRKGKYITLIYLKTIEERLDSSLFIRVHKSYIVSVDKIDGIEGNEVYIQSERIPISRNYREQVLSNIVMNNLWGKIKLT